MVYVAASIDTQTTQFHVGLTWCNITISYSSIACVQFKLPLSKMQECRTKLRVCVLAHTTMAHGGLLTDYTKGLVSSNAPIITSNLVRYWMCLLPMHPGDSAFNTDALPCRHAP